MGKKSIFMKEEEEKNIVNALIWSAKIFALQSCWRVFVQLKIRAFNIVYYIDISLKDVILVLSWGARK